MSYKQYEIASPSELQHIIDSHEKGNAMFLRADVFYAMARELQEHREAAALHFQRGYDDGHSRGLTCGKLYKGDDQMRMHRAECVAAYKAELRGGESDE
ncbi:hypothetical protein ACJ5MI_004702 [Escherichia coli]